MIKMILFLLAFCLLTISTASAQLYGIDNQNDQLLQIDPSSGAATVAGPFGLDVAASGADFAPDGTLWMLAGGPDGTGLYTVDLSSGAATLQVAVVFLNGGGHAIAFSADGSTLYAPDGADLATIDPATGIVTQLGDLGLGSSHSNLTEGPGGRLYTITSSEELVSIDPATLTASTVGSLGISGNFAAVTYDPDTDQILGVETGADELYAVDPFTGTATSIGPLGIASGVGGLAYPDQGPVTASQATWGQLKSRFPGTTGGAQR